MKLASLQRLSLGKIHTPNEILPKVNLFGEHCQFLEILFTRNILFVSPKFCLEKRFRSKLSEERDFDLNFLKIKKIDFQQRSKVDFNAENGSKGDSLYANYSTC